MRRADRHLPVVRRAAAVAAAGLFVAACGAAREVGGETDPCTRCHGSDGVSAPPRSLLGASSSSDAGVGAHRRHLADGPIRRAVGCEACHVVPSRWEGHFDDGDPRGRATLTFGVLARARGASPSWDHDSATCSGVYCHSATLEAGGAATAPRWTVVDGSQRACGSCHGYPPATATHPQGVFATRCAACHPGTVLEDHATIDVAGGKHVDGALDVAFTGGCDGCHGAPPTSGAHLVHANPPTAGDASYGGLHVLEDVSPAGGPRYDFGCGNCHPVEAARHLDGTVDVVLAPAGAAAGSVKARNAPDAAFDVTLGTCSGAYCHSSGQESPVYVTAPPWTAPPGSLGCSGCHGNPPRYESGGAGSGTANSHLVLADDGWESGHFLGLPGPWHTSKHGGFWGPGQDAAPISCQACHYDTTDPTNTGPSGFYYLDTSGSYQLPGGDPSRLDSAIYSHLQCTACHVAGGAAPTGTGRVLPLRHVNGSRDVVFDPRSSLPEIAWLPQGAARPTAPYWATQWNAAIPPGAASGGGTVAFGLGGAGYDPVTKTCSNVACHIEETQVRWGVSPVGWATCDACHQLLH